MLFRSIGLAPFCMQLAGSLVQVVSNNSLKAAGGDMAIGAMTVITSICTIFIMPIFGLNQGAQPILGFNYGAKNFERVKRTYLLGLFWCTVILIISAIGIQVFPEILIKMFNQDETLAAIALRGIRIFLFCLPVIGIQMTSSNFFQATGKPKKAMFIGLTRQVIFYIPAVILFSRMWGLDGIWFSGAMADGIAAIMSATVMIIEFKKMNQKD